MKTKQVAAGRSRRKPASDGRPVSLRDVAKCCGLSVYPVSRVLNGKSGVRDATAARIREAAESLGYRPELNQAARRLASRKSGQLPLNHVIGLLIPGHLGKVRFFYELFRGIAEEVSSGGFGLLMLPTYDPVAHRALPLQLPPAIWRGEVDGLIAHHGLSESLMEGLRGAPGFGSHPIVSLNARIRGGASVLRDERAGGRLSLEHLLALGHRRVLYLRHRGGGYPCEDRLAGYTAACAAAGVHPRQCLLPVDIEQEHMVETALREALHKHPEATALLTLNDPNAIQTCYALERLGVRVPDDMSVVGWDDTDPLPDVAGNNRLTSVAFDIAEMGRTAARMVMEALGGPEAVPANVLMPARLSVRLTTAPPREQRA